MATNDSFDVIEAFASAWRHLSDRELLTLVALVTFVGSAFDITALATDRTADSLPALSALMILSATILLFAANLYFWPRIIRVSMKLAGVDAKKEAPGIGAWLVFVVRMFVTNLFCLFDKKLLLPALGLFIAALVLGPIAVLQDSDAILNAALTVGMVGFLAWLVAVIVHVTRTFFAHYFFVRGDAPAQESLRMSYDKTKGRFWSVFFSLALIFLFSLPAAIIIGFIGEGVEQLAAYLAWPAYAGIIAGTIIAFPFSVLYSAFVMLALALMFAYYDKRLGKPGGRK